MKHIYLKLNLICLTILGLALASCSSDDNDDFQGSDNYIISFSLTQNGTKYQAGIQDNRIIVTIPSNVDLSTGAKAEVKLGELTKITPDPTSITDWSKELQFVVTSYNNTERNYTYTVEYSETIANTTVKLLNQKDVDEFGKKGIQAIEGNLIIGKDGAISEEEAITNLKGLQKLVSVSKNITIKSSFTGSDLTGLDNLKQASNIYIGSTSESLNSEALTNIELPSLEKTSELVLNVPSAKVLSMPLLKSAFAIYVISENIETVDFPLLETISGNLYFKEGLKNSSANKELKEINFESLKSIEGSLLIKDLREIEAVNMPKLQTLGGEFSLNSGQNLKTLNLSNLAIVGGNVELADIEILTSALLPKLESVKNLKFDGGYNKGLINETDFSSLKQVDGHFLLKSKGDIKKVSFPQLTQVSEKLEIYGSEKITDIELPVLSDCKEIYFYNLHALEELNLPQIKQIETIELVSCPTLAKIKSFIIQNLILNGGSKDAPIPVIEGTTEILGDYKISNYNKTKDFVFANLTKVKSFNFNSSGISGGKSTLSFPDLTQIETLKFSGTTLNRIDFPNLKEVTTLWDSSFFQYIKTEDIIVPKLTKVGTFKFIGGTFAGVADKMPLKNMDAFKNLKEVDEVIMEHWGNLTDYSGLKNIFPKLKKENWKLKGNKYNPTYEQMIDGEFTQE